MPQRTARISGKTLRITCMSDLITMVLPPVLGEHLPIVIGVLSVPLALAFDTDSYFYGMLPVMLGIGEGFGIAPIGVAVAMVICRNCATFISPMVPATLLGIGLADVDIKDHIKASLPLGILHHLYGVCRCHRHHAAVRIRSYIQQCRLSINLAWL